MNKAVKIILILLAFLIVLVAIAAVGLKVYFTSDRLKALVIPRVEEQISRTVEVEKITFSILPHISLKINNLSISNPPEHTFKEDRFFSLDELILNVELWPLFRKELQITEITLHRPDVYLEINAEGVSNFILEMGNSTQEVADEAQGGEEISPLALFLSDFSIIDGIIEFVDVQGDQRVHVAGLNQSLTAVITEGGENVHFSSQATSDGISYGSLKSDLISQLPLEASMAMTFRGNEDKLYIDSVSVAIREIALDIKGSVSNIQTEPELDLSVNSTRADIEQLLSLVPKEFLKESEGLTSTGKFQFAMTVKGAVGSDKQPAVEGTFSVSDGSIQYPDLPQAVTNINLSGSFIQPASTGQKTAPGKMQISAFSASLGSSDLSGKLSVINFDDPMISGTFNGSMNLSEVKDYYPLEKGLELSGSVTANVKIDGKAADPTKMKASGKIEFKKVNVKTSNLDKPLENLSGTLTFNNERIEAKKFKMVIGSSDLRFDLKLSNYMGLVLDQAASGRKPHASMTLKSKQLHTADIMQQSAQTESGKGGEEPQVDLMFPDIDADIKATIGKLVTEKFEFSDVRGKVKLRNQVLTLENFSLKGFDGSLTTKGKLDFRSQDKIPFDLKLDIKSVQANSMLPHFTTFGDKIFGGFSLSGTMKGTLNDTLGLDPNSLNGGGKVKIKDGRIVGYPLTNTLANFTGIQEFRELIFKNWTGDMKVENGRVTLSKTKIKAGENDIVLSGSQGILDGTMDFKLKVKFSEKQVKKLKITGLAGDIVEYLKDDQGKVNLDLLIRGTAKNPTITLDQKQVEAAAKKALEHKAKEELKKLEDETKDKLEDALDDALKNIFGK